jgi:hypothetical protein
VAEGVARDGLLGESRPSGYPCECRRLQHLHYFRELPVTRPESSQTMQLVCISPRNSRRSLEISLSGSAEPRELPMGLFRCREKW